MKNIFMVIILSLVCLGKVYAANNNDASERIKSEKQDNKKTVIENEISVVHNKSDDEKSALEEEKFLQNKEQLDGYQGLTKWLIDNKSEFDKVIKETSKETKTKWFLKDPQQEINKNTNQIDTSKPLNDNLSCENNKYFVKKGDTLYSISKKYNISINTLQKLNNIKNNNSLIIGSKIIISGIPCENTTTSKNILEDANKISEKDLENSVKQNQNISEKETNNNFDKNINNRNKPEYIFYKVKLKDTIYSIAKEHNMTSDELISLNNISSKAPLSIDTIIKVRSNYNNINMIKAVSDSDLLKDGFIWPVIGRLLIPYGPQKGGIVNEGINISAKKGTQVKAVQDGIVIYVGAALEKFGTIVLIQHDKTWVSTYAHVNSVSVKKGDAVKKGQIIASVGIYGATHEPQLHFELRKNIEPVDPLFYLNSYR